MDDLDKDRFGDVDGFQSTEDFDNSLSKFLNSGYQVWDGILCESKQLVDKLGKVRIVIYPNEHAPPHFHVKGPDIDASFRISDCSRLPGGQINQKKYDLIRYWHERSKTRLIEVWNETRPSDCYVGKIR